MVFRIVIITLALAACYAVFAIAVDWRFYHKLRTPEAAFTVKNDAGELSIIEFLNYDCQYCRETHKVLMEYANTHTDVRIVVRPFPNVGGYSEEAAEMVLAAGVQGKFWEMDEAITGYGGKPDEKFYRETSALLDIDYEKMRKDSESSAVQEMVGDNADAVLMLDIQKVPAIMIGKTVYQLDNPLTLSDLISKVAEQRGR